MKPYFIIYLLLITCLTGCSSWSSTDENSWLTQIVSEYPELKNKQAEIRVVKRVIDGDTFATDQDERVRLIGVNTPEVTGKAQYYSQEASEFSEKRLTGQTVYLFKDLSETDRYGRLLRYVFVKDDPVMFNETLIAQGYANTMTIQPDSLFAKTFVQLERQAREQNNGLWGYEEPVPACDNPMIKGNINSRKEKIYHIPGGQYYDVTKPEALFCTEDEAIAAGYRRSSN